MQEYSLGYQVAIRRIVSCMARKYVDLDLSNISLQKIPPDIAECHWLQTLNVSNNQISDLIPISSLTSLQTLNLNSNQISNLEPLGQLASLQTLDLSTNQISDLKPLGQLALLKTLDASKNQISDLIPISSLTSMQTLNLNSNQIIDLEPLETLASLKTLDLRENHISDLKPLARIALLQLNVSNNLIKDIEPLHNLALLEILDVSSNQITDMMPIHGLVSLRKLDISKNQIRDLIIMGGHSSLNELDISRNQISKLKPISSFTKLWKLRVHGNPFRDIPIELLDYNDCRDNVQAWFKEIRDGKGSEVNLNAKLMFTGNGYVGKSTIKKALRFGKWKHDETSTQGISIESLVIGTVDYHVWDFGGQEIYYGTHRLFLESQAIQLIVLDAEKEVAAVKNVISFDRITKEEIREFQSKYWLQNARELSPQSQFIIVQNKKDKFPEILPHIQQLAKQNEVEYLHVSAYTGEGIEALKNTITEKTKKLLHYGMLMPQSWLSIRKQLIENMQRPAKKREQIITRNEFVKRCDAEHVLQNSIPALLKLLHNSGYLFFNESYLGDKIIVDQEWAVKAIYKPLERGSDFYNDMRYHSKGLARIEKLFSAFGEEYDIKVKWLFLNFMQSCGLCFLVRNHELERRELPEDVFVFPEFMENEIPKHAQQIWGLLKRTSLKHYRLNLENLSRREVLGLLVSLGQKTQLDNIWRNGILISTPDGYFIIMADYDAKSINIVIEPTAEEIWLHRITETLNRQFRVSEDKMNWEISDDGISFSQFDPEEAKKASFIKQFYEVPKDEKRKKILLSESLPDIKQTLPPRFLKAIMFTDLKGSTTVIDRDERHAIELHDKLESTIIKFTEKHGGEYLQWTGDGTYCVFPSSVEAARAAIEIQLALQDEDELLLRLSLHAGDIKQRGLKNYIGRAVVIASRIETFSVPRSIFISARLRDDLISHSEFKTVSMGKFEFEGIEEPVEIYAIDHSGLLIPENRSELQGKGKRIGD